MGIWRFPLSDVAVDGPRRPFNNVSTSAMICWIRSGDRSDRPGIVGIVGIVSRFWRSAFSDGMAVCPRSFFNTLSTSAMICWTRDGDRPDMPAFTGMGSRFSLPDVTGVFPRSFVNKVSTSARICCIRDGDRVDSPGIVRLGRSRFRLARSALRGSLLELVVVVVSGVPSPRFDKRPVTAPVMDFRSDCTDPARPPATPVPLSADWTWAAYVLKGA